VSNIYGEIILYSTGCPKCKVLKQKLDAKGLCYTEVGDVEQMTALGITMVPILSVDGSLMEFFEANQWINRQ